MLSDEEIIAIRDSLLPSQGEQFDCLAFARAIESAVVMSLLRARHLARLRAMESGEHPGS